MTIRTRIAATLGVVALATTLVLPATASAANDADTGDNVVTLAPEAGPLEPWDPEIDDFVPCTEDCGPDPEPPGPGIPPGPDDLCNDPCYPPPVDPEPDPVPEAEPADPVVATPTFTG